MKIKATKIYIAGPISGMEEKASVNFAETEKALNEEGYAVLNPMIDAKFTHVFNYMDWIKHGLFLLDLAEAIYMLPGWHSSKGARLEHAYAICRGIKIIYAERAEVIIPIDKLSGYINQKVPLSDGAAVELTNDNPGQILRFTDGNKGEALEKSSVDSIKDSIKASLGAVNAGW